MTELDDRVYYKILALSDEGENLLELGHTQSAISTFQQAVDLLPEPKSAWEASEWLHAAIGDAYYRQGDYENALNNFQAARMAGSEAEPNPYILLRLGSCYYRLGNREMASQYLISAFMMEGEEIFVEEDEDVREFLASII